MDWREYIQQREHFADLPMPVVPLMVARPGATEPGLFPAMRLEQSEAEAFAAEQKRQAQRRRYLARRKREAEEASVNAEPLDAEGMTIGEYAQRFHKR